MIIDHQVPDSPPEQGLPIGNLTSQYFANLYLGELDHFLKDQCQVTCYLRYMDDFLLFHTKKQELKDLQKVIEFFLNKKLHLELKEKVTQLSPVSEGVPFLGFRVFPNLIRIQRQSLIRLNKKIHSREKAFLMGRISVEEMTVSVASMVAHISHSNSHRWRQKNLEDSMRFG